MSSPPYKRFPNDADNPARTTLVAGSVVKELLALQSMIPNVNRAINKLIVECFSMFAKNSTQSLQPRDGPKLTGCLGKFYTRIVILVILLLNVYCLSHVYMISNIKANPDLKQVQKCAIDNFHVDLSFLDSAEPIDADEFLERRNRLARALVASSVDGFVLEPGYSFQYYGNISQTDWEPWEPEERPFLMLILPEVLQSGEVLAKTAFLAPHFEEGRVRMLGIPSNEAELDIVTWEEHWDPYATLYKSHLFTRFNVAKEWQAPKLMVDEEIRDFISRGLGNAGFQTTGLTPGVELVRQIKSQAEVEILRAVNTGTVMAVRAMRPCLVPNLTENEVRDILDAVLVSIGFSKFFNMVLFEEHGSSPHGGSVVGGKKATEETMIVIDVGAHYLGYSSDICRSFFIDPAKPRTSSVLLNLFQSLGILSYGSYQDTARLGLHAEKLKVWNIVLEAQSAAAAAFKPNNTAASVDIAARSVIEDAGYGGCFTHRLGHSIGIKAHESPYLNKWNRELLLKPGMVFTNEPGIYLDGKFGVRHEDVYLVNEDGDAELLTGRRAVSPYDP
ncbi:peptidase M24, structural domain-containing protein [Xylariaceae sp. FL1651]|nr:peptidase M24, structural domain-containing protein [Xylariaceae sp. FL1651]